MVVLHRRWTDPGDPVVDQRIPLIRLAADEAVELVEPLARRPTVERTRDAGFPGSGFVPLAERAGAVAVESQHLGQRRDAVRKLPRVAGEPGRGFHDRAGVCGVVVPTGLERHSRRRAERRRMEVVVPQAGRREPVEGRCPDRAPEGAGSAEADVVDQHDHDVRGILGRRHLEQRRCCHVAHVQLAIGRRFGRLNRQHRSIEPLLVAVRELLPPSRPEGPPWYKP